MTRSVVDPVIAAAPIVERLAPLVDAFAAADFELALVGGVVRDLALGVAGTSDDVDATTDARPDDIKRIVAPLADAVWAQGERFGTIGLRLGGDDLEITTHRAERYDPTSRKPVVAFGDDLVTDLARRDFTINAMAIDTRTSRLVDPHDGLTDLASGRLRTPLSPTTSFGDDPLRMLRAARFLARFGLEPDPDLTVAMTSMADRLEIVSGERIRDELDKLLALPDPRSGLDLLASTGLLRRVEATWDGHAVAAPALTAVLGDPGASVELRRAVLLGLADDPEQVLQTLRHAGATRRAVLGALALADELDDGAATDDAFVRRWRRRLGAGDLTLALDLAAAHGHDVGPISARHAELASTEELDRPTPPLDGAEVMALLGVSGPDVGAAMAELERVRLDRGTIPAAEAENLLGRWWSARSGPVDSEH